MFVYLVVCLSAYLLALCVVFVSLCVFLRVCLFACFVDVAFYPQCVCLCACALACLACVVFVSLCVCLFI